MSELIREPRVKVKSETQVGRIVLTGLKIQQCKGASAVSGISNDPYSLTLCKPG